MPPHAGHLHLIRTAMGQVDELTVLVCTVEREPLAGKLRFDWMQELVPDAKLVHVTDEVPSYPHESPDFWDYWLPLLKREAGDAEVFFSSEDYGFEVAERLQIAHVLVDRERKHFPVSASMIRRQPLLHWEHIPPAVRPHYLKRIVLTGPESTGKSTLAQKLALHFNTAFVEEYGREYFVAKNGRLSLEDFPEIARGQAEREELAARTADRLLFCDTDAIVTQIWSEIYFQSCLPQVIELSRERRYDLFLLMDIDIPWEDDGTREFPQLRQWHFDRIRRELDERQLPYVIISGDFDTRFEEAVRAVERLISGGIEGIG